MGTALNDRIKKSVYNSDGSTDPKYLIFGLDGDDTIDGANNDDQVIGGLGQDQIETDQGHDAAWGMEDADRIFTREGDDYADGGAGNDRIYTHQGNDTLVGGLGDNTMNGGSGIDLFVSQYVRGSGDRDVIYGMDEVGEKLIIGGIENLDYNIKFTNDLVLFDRYGQEVARVTDLAQTQRSNAPEWGSRVRLQGNTVEIIERVDRFGIFVETTEGTPVLPVTTRPVPVPCNTVPDPVAPIAEQAGDGPEAVPEQPQQPSSNPGTPGTDGAQPSTATPGAPQPEPVASQPPADGGNLPGQNNDGNNTGGTNSQPPINININIDNTDNNNNTNTIVNDFSTEIFEIQQINLNLDDMISSETPKRERITGTRSDDIIGSGPGLNKLKGMRGGDQFVFNEADKFRKKAADQIVDFNPDQGDQIVVSDEALPGLKDPTFATASSKRDLKALAKEVVDLIYFQRKGQLYYNGNEDERGMGKGGLFAVLKNKPELSSEELAVLAG